ncbi:MAG TPA: hypothetical protein VME47_10120 [Acetobacteraceae bacterium]|nr:hypothetical protein [Acetobacteraceae bacterium]
MERLRRLLFEHPLAKGIGLGLLGILGNVLAGAYVFDITRSDPKSGQFLDWRQTAGSGAFWGLVAVVCLIGFYTWGMARTETKIRRALTDADIRARAFEVLLDPLLEAVKRDIQEGKIRPMSEVLAMLGIEQDKRR